MSEISRILKAAVPQGKALAWLLGAGATCFMAGIGFILSLSAYGALPGTVAAQDTAHRTLIDSVKTQVSAVSTTVTANTGAIATLTGSVATLRIAQEDAADDRVRILCLLELTATGTVLPAASVARRCP
jgi:hypothetical protein